MYVHIYIYAYTCVYYVHLQAKSIYIEQWESSLILERIILGNHIRIRNSNSLTNTPHIHTAHIHSYAHLLPQLPQSAGCSITIVWVLFFVLEFVSCAPSAARSSSAPQYDADVDNVVATISPSP